METRKSRKTKIGMVVSDKMDKTAIVKVERKIQHPRYQKIIRRSKRFFVDDPENTAKEGDWVEVMETRPLSKNKRWRLVRVLERE